MIVWVADGLRVRYTHVQAVDLGQEVCSAPSDKRGNLRIVLVIGPGIVSSDTQAFQIWRENFRHGDGRLYRLAFSRATPCGSGQELDSNAETRQSWEVFERWELDSGKAKDSKLGETEMIRGGQCLEQEYYGVVVEAATELVPAMGSVLADSYSYP